MGYLAWMNKHVKRMDAWDVALTKWSVFFCTLFLVVLFPVLASLEWYWYLLLSVVIAARPVIHIFR